MNTRIFTVLFTLLIATADAAKRPNVILVMTDDQGFGDLRCHGNSMIKTPNLDRLHSQSVRFTDFHVDPTCSPTRAALLTGRHSTRTGVWHTVMGRSILFADEVTVASVFADAGYRTGIFGKWHLGDNFPARPQDRGFTDTLIHGGGGVGQTPDLWGNDYFDDTYLLNGKPTKTEGYCTKVFFDHALKFIERNRSRPFFCYLPTNVPHSPYYVSEKYRRPYLNQGVVEPMASFYGMITEFDENMGRLESKLQRLGLAENTIVIFMTDNGTAAGRWWKRDPKAKQPRWIGFNADMRGGKGSQYDGGHRVPFFVRWPAGGIAGGRDVSRLTAHIDVLPTLTELCGLPLPANRKLDGKSLVPLLRGHGSDWPERTLFAHFQREEIPPKWTRSVVMTERWRLVDGKELYEIKVDPGQSVDVADQNYEVVKSLKAKYEAWWKTLEPRFDQYGWIVLGTKAENPALITSHDWHVKNTGNIPWHQSHIKKGLKSNGYWMVDFTRSGRYEFTLRQRPDHPIDGNRASVWVGHRESSVEIPEGATAVKITMNIEAGRKRMQSEFSGLEEGGKRGAYYVDVRFLN